MKGRGSRSAGVAVLAALVASILVIGWDVSPVRSLHHRTEVLGVQYRRTSDTLADLPIPDPMSLARNDEPATPPPGDMAIAPPPAEFTGPPPKAAPPPKQLRRATFDGVTPAGGTWAVSIGINDYPGTAHDLKSAVTDAGDVDAALAHFGVPADHRLLIRDGQASAGTVRLAADWLVAHAGPDAVAVFFYAGHVRKLSSTTEAIVAADGGVVTDADLASHLDGLRAKRTWIGLAACYAGGFDELLKPGRVLTAAADANSEAYENSMFGRSYMVEYMVHRAMLQDLASTSVQSAFAYARAGLSQDYPNRVPVEYDAAGGDVDVRMAGAARPASSGAASSSGAPASPTTTTPPSGPSGGSAGDNQPKPNPDNCSNLTLGVVRCSG